MIYSCVKEGWVRLDRRGNEKKWLDDSVFFDAEYKNEKNIQNLFFISVKIPLAGEKNTVKDFAGLFSGLFLQNFFEKILFIEKMVLFYERSANVSANEKSNVRESSGEPQQFSCFIF